jgi:ATP-dependent Zn protease
MNQKTPQQPGRGGLGGGKAGKSAALWVMILVAVIMMFQFTSGQRTSTPNISYTVFRSELENKNIEKVEILDGARISKGTFRREVDIKGQSVKHFSLDFPVKDSESDKDLLHGT